jgi:hypothetical protein
VTSSPTAATSGRSLSTEPSHAAPVELVIAMRGTRSRHAGNPDDRFQRFAAAPRAIASATTRSPAERLSSVAAQPGAALLPSVTAAQHRNRQRGQECRNGDNAEVMVGLGLPYRGRAEVGIWGPKSLRGQAACRSGEALRGSALKASSFPPMRARAASVAARDRGGPIPRWRGRCRSVAVRDDRVARRGRRRRNRFRPRRRAARSRDP